MSNTKKKGSKNRSSHEKRISQSAPKSLQEKQAKIERERAEREARAKKKATANQSKKIMAIVFSALLILAFAIPSLTALSTCSQKQEETLSSSQAYDQIIERYGGDSAAALEDLKARSGQEPENATVWAELGYVYSYTGDNDNAIVALQKAVELDPNDNAGAKTLASQLLAELGQ